MKLLLSILTVFMGATAFAQLSVSPSTVNFYDIPVNSYGYEKYVYIHNYGNETVQLDLSENCPYDFQIRHYSCWTLKPNDSCDVRIGFRPSREGQQSCHLTVRTHIGGYNGVWIYGRGTKRP